MTEWYRRKTWTGDDEQEFFAKLGRARKDGRAQYLKIQAIELIETKEPKLLDIAEILLNKVLDDYPDDRCERSQTLNSLGEIRAQRGDFDGALFYFRKSLDFEREFPNVLTGAYLNFSETVIRIQRTELYDDVVSLLTDRMKIDSLRFPVENYIIFSVLSIIYRSKGDLSAAQFCADEAEKNATAKNNSLWNERKRKYGIVIDRKPWLDDLVKQR